MGGGLVGEKRTIGRRSDCSERSDYSDDSALSEHSDYSDRRLGFDTCVL